MSTYSGNDSSSNEDCDATQAHIPTVPNKSPGTKSSGTCSDDTTQWLLNQKALDSLLTYTNLAQSTYTHTKSVSSFPQHFEVDLTKFNKLHFPGTFKLCPLGELNKFLLIHEQHPMFHSPALATYPIIRNEKAEWTPDEQKEYDHIVDQIDMNQTQGHDDTSDKAKRLQTRNLKQQLAEKNAELTTFEVNYRTLINRLETLQNLQLVDGVTENDLKELTDLKISYTKCVQVSHK